jgi:3-hydroxyisobutyrate dehydrogenase-like beta-hydroxyacid dehydrogenase
MKVGFIGAGRMGRPMVSRLVEAGHQVRVLGRSAETRSEIASLGAHAVTDLAAVADTAELVIVCVFTDEQVQEVCLAGDLPATMAPGSTLVVHTTGSPRTAEALATAAAPHPVGVVDAPVSGGPHDAAAGHLTLFVGGTDDDVTRVRPALACYGDPLIHVGPTGAGQRVKLVNNTLFAAQIGLLSEAVDLGRRLGLPEAALLEALCHGSGSSRALSSIAPRGSVEAFIAMVGDFIGKDVAVIRKIVAELGSDLGRLDDIVGAGLGG